MKEPHRITKKEGEMKETLDLKKSLNVRVISHKGLVLGKVLQIRFHPIKRVLEGILVSRGFFKKPLYIGSSYINKISHESIILDIEPSILLRGRIVIDSKGKKLGKVKQVIRKNHSNDIKELRVGSLFRKDFIINLSNVKLLGESIILNPNYHVKRKYFWQKS